MKKQNKKILIAVAVLIGIVFIAMNLNNTFSFYKANFPAHTIEKISSDGIYPNANSMVIGVRAFVPGGGNIANEPACVNTLDEITLGGTTGNDDNHVVFGDRNEFYQYIKYPLQNIQVSNVKAVRYWSCSSNSRGGQSTEEGITATLENLTGYCEIQDAFHVNCVVSGGEFRAFLNGQEITGEDGLAYYGIDSISGEFTVLKIGIEQLVSPIQEPLPQPIPSPTPLPSPAPTPQPEPTPGGSQNVIWYILGLVALVGALFWVYLSTRKNKNI